MWPVDNPELTGELAGITPFKQLVSASQPYGRMCTNVGKMSNNLVVGADALVTKRANGGLMVRSADCVPILLYGQSTVAIGVIHAGWRGLIAGVISSTLDQFISLGTDQSTLSVVIGPSARVCCYEVDSPTDGAPMLRPQLGSSNQRFLINRGGKTYLDLVGLATAQLLGAGVNQSSITADPRCTIHAASLPSFRRTGVTAPSIAGVIGLLPTDI